MFAQCAPKQRKLSSVKVWEKLLRMQLCSKGENCKGQHLYSARKIGAPLIWSGTFCQIKR